MDKGEMKRHDPTGSERQKRYTENLKKKGYKRISVWAKPENAQKIRDFAKSLEG